MIKGPIKILINFILFVLLQVLILNNIHLFKLVTPFLYLYILIKIPITTSRVQVITLSFITGLVIDIFSNTLGLHAIACTFVGLCRAPLIHIFLNKEPVEGASPSFRSMGTANFMLFTLSFITIHHVTMFLVESVSLFDPLFLTIRIFASILLTSLAVFIVEAFNIDNHKNGES